MMLILINNNYLETININKIYVPAHTIIGTKLIECIKIQELKIDNNIVKKEILFLKDEINRVYKDENRYWRIIGFYKNKLVKWAQ